MSKFDYVKYDEQATKKQENFKNQCMLLDCSIDSLPNGRYKSLAFTDLEKVYMWIGKAIRDEQISRNQLTELQEQRCNS